MTNAISTRAAPRLKFDRSVTLLAWGFNEELLIEQFLNRAVALLDETVEEWEIVFVNDGSVDRTGAIADAYAAREPRLRVLHNERNSDVGYSARRAINSATKEYMLWQTVDWAYDITHLRIYLEMTRSFDVVVGVRPYPIRALSYIPVIRSIFRIRTRSDNLRRAFVSLGNYYILKILFGPSFQDFQNVQIYPLSSVQSFELSGNSSFLVPELLFRCFQAGMTFLEVPIPFKRRTAGEGKGIRLVSIRRSLVDILRNWFKWGYKLRIETLSSQFGDKKPARRIFRLIEPTHLDEEVIRWCAPLFRLFAQR